MDTSQIYQVLKNLTGMENSYLEYYNHTKDFSTVDTYAKYFDNRMIIEKKLYWYYFPALLSPYKNHPGTIKEIGQIKSTENIYPGYDFSICKNFNFPDGPLHNCDYFTLVYMLEGQGECKLSERALAMMPGDIYLIPPGVDYALNPNRDAICICMNLRYSFVAANYKSIFVNDARLLDFVSHAVIRQEQNMYAALHAVKNEKTTEIILQLFSEYLEQKENSNTVMRCLLTVFFAYVFRDKDLKWDCSENTSRTTDHMYQINKYIQQNYRTATLTELSASVHFSKQYVCKVIKQETGGTFSSLLNQTRVKMACEFLMESDCSINEIAYLCGFSESSNFSRQFKQQIGVSPSAYRKQKT